MISLPSAAWLIWGTVTMVTGIAVSAVMAIIISMPASKPAPGPLSWRYDLLDTWRR